MPSIANQDFKIYGFFKDRSVYGPAGIRGDFCAELYAAYLRATDSKSLCSLVDSFVLDSDTMPTRMTCPGVWFNVPNEEWKQISPGHNNPAYYDSLWAIQQAIYNYIGAGVGENLEFGIVDGNLVEESPGYHFVNEDGYHIKATAADGKLASLYLGEKAEEDCPVVRFESLLPLVGELPLGTTEIW